MSNNLSIKNIRFKFTDKSLVRLSIFVLLYCSGTFFYSLYLPAVVTGCTIFIAVVLMASSHTLQENAFYLFFVSASCILCTCIVNMDSDVYSYLQPMAYLVIGMLAVGVFEFDKLVKEYINVMYVLAMISLFFWAVGLIYPPFVFHLPSTAYHDCKTFLGIQMYLFDLDWIGAVNLMERRLYVRNSGMFREPGLYQVYLNLALMFLLFGKKSFSSFGKIDRRKAQKLWERKVAIIVFATVTTLSTSGIMVLAFMVILYLITSKKFNWKWGIMLAAGTVLAFTKGFNILFQKLIPGSATYSSFTTRFDGALKDIQLWTENIITGIGITSYEANSIGTSNSVSFTMAQFGIFFAAIEVMLLYTVIRRIEKSSLVSLFLLLIMIVDLSTQPVFTFPFFQALFFVAYCRKGNTSPNRPGDSFQLTGERMG